MSKLPTLSSQNVTRISKAMPVSPNAALEAFNMLVGAHREYKQTVEVEQTKRAASAAWRDVNVERLKQQGEFLQNYLQNTFAERRNTIDKMFKRLDDGVANGDLDMVNMAMNSIVGIVQSSPLKEAEKIIQALNDPSVQHIEF